MGHGLWRQAIQAIVDDERKTLEHLQKVWPLWTSGVGTARFIPFKRQKEAEK